GFEPYVARPDVAVVVLAIRWSSHSFGEVKEFCDQYGKPLGRLPGGYNPNQVALQILGQCSERLRAGESLTLPARSWVGGGLCFCRGRWVAACCNSEKAAGGSRSDNPWKCH